MSLKPVEILGHFQLMTTGSYVNLEKREFTTKDEWKQFFTQALSAGKRPPSVSFSSRKVVMLTTVTGDENWIGLIKEEVVSPKSLKLIVNNIDFSQAVFGQSTECASYLFLSVDRDQQVEIVEEKSCARLDKLTNLAKDLQTASLKVYQLQKEYKKLPSNNLSDEQKKLQQSYLKAEKKSLKLQDKLSAAEMTIKSELCGPDLSIVKS